jgi:hypothetical protein
MSLVHIGPTQPPIPATPTTIWETLSTFARSQATPRDVTGILDVSNYLMETSVIHYEFAALAVEKSLQALELMIRLKVNPESNDGMSRLVNSLRKKNTIRPELDGFLKDMVHLRNHWVGHPRNAAAYAMVSAVGFLSHIHAAIAELAELPEPYVRTTVVSAFG